MADELPEEITIGEIRLEPGIPFHYEAWGIRYRFKGGDWQLVDMAFRKKSDANDWIKRNYRQAKGLEGEIIHVKRTVLLTEKGNIQTETEAFTE